MNDSEEYFLGDSEDPTEFFLGDVSSQNETTSNERLEDSQEYQELLSVYEGLKIADHPRCKGDSSSLQDMFQEYFKDNPDIFIIAGSDYYKPLNESEYLLFEEKCDRLINTAHKYWISIENQSKLEEITAALNTLKAIFRQPAKTNAYSNEIKRLLRAHLNAVLNQKIRDKILEVSEIKEILEIAISIHLIPDTVSGRNIILSAIQKATEKKIFKIESFEETFIRLVSSRDKIERLDTDTVRSNLFKEYKSLAEISSQVLADSKLVNDTELFEDMCQLLSDNNILVSNTELFIRDFFEPEIQKKGEFYFSVPIPSEYYYYIKGTAINIYQLTEEQWHQLCFIRNIRVDTETTVAFIMGNHKESSLKGISQLLSDNSDMAASRILAGDLETFFTHIGGIGKQIAPQIKQLKLAYKTNNQELVDGVVNILNQFVDGEISENPSAPKESETIGKLITEEADIKDIVRFIIENKSDEVLIKELVRESEIKERIISLFYSKKKKYSYTQFLMNIMYELLLLSDISQYKFSFINIAISVQKDLLAKNDYLTFVCVYSRIIEKAVTDKIISEENEIQNYKESYMTMKQEYDSEYEILNPKTKKKSMFSLFKKGE